MDEPLTEPVEDLAGRLYGLVIRLADRLPADQVQWLHHVVEVGEYGLALEDMAGMLAYSKITITDQERSDMLALARQMKMDGLVPDALRFCPRAPSATEQIPDDREWP